ncbi:MAG TPA: class A beta-lactamase [Povalibacter sp.]|uniref:class A beta-lactamase n=1 Tax=Povalibacter sp. TaxID=1962978 RepID=UPI002C32D3C6|nr:class A beta-lactamase [Povalibacter sp.]HMN46486.1 class A beta-lactamase [Povalibacter sp.]
MRTKLLAGLTMMVLLATRALAGAPTAPIEAEIQRLAVIGGGTVGVAAWRIDGQGPRVLVNAGERFPMASTFKIAVAGALLAQVDAGRLDLQQMIAVDPALYVPSEVIADRFIHPGVSLSLHNLLELMLTQSDNTATDVLTKLAGGPQAVTAWVHRQQVEDLRVDRDTAALLRDFFVLPAGPIEKAFAQAVQQNPALEKQGGLPNPAFDDDVRDTSTPDAMTQLLTRIFRGEALSAGSTRTLVAIMERCRTGDARLRGRLPPGIVVADKTGTIGGSINDVGVITLPDGRGQIAITVFIKKSALPFAQRERAIAEIARVVYDYFLFAHAG